VAGRHVVLIDDVVTTGSTAIEAASTLRGAGAASIAVWAVARALA
jgi:predicted amidophosphoribosyltransferase